MTDGPTAADLERIAETLDRHNVQYVIVGGVAGLAHGAQRPTRDIDVVPRSDAENLARLAAALRELKAQIRGAPPLPDAVMAAQLHPAALAKRQFGNWTTVAGELDTALFIGTHEDPIDYEYLLDRAVRTQLQGITIVVASLGDIIRAKEIADRKKDREVLPELRQLYQAQQDPTADDDRHSLPDGPS